MRIATDTSPAAGSPVEVINGRHHVTLSAALLASRWPSPGWWPTAMSMGAATSPASWTSTWAPGPRT